ncbi:lipocalin-like domain-containing protein [Streptomyces sp. NPDC059850]|uniref:lipocalin-like domain-containing protein n=1 Tax=Streptomyces sp. NPDC059850 TaxID=3346970 RepID=UPI003647F1E4
MPSGSRPGSTTRPPSGRRSTPGLTTSGTITADGVTRRVAGRTWFDRQWGTPGDEPSPVVTPPWRSPSRTPRLRRHHLYRRLHRDRHLRGAAHHRTRLHGHHRVTTKRRGYGLAAAAVHRQMPEGRRFRTARGVRLPSPRGPCRGR